MSGVDPLTFALACAAGGLGAVARLVLDGLVRERLRGAFPWGTAIINASGSLLLGLLAGLVSGHAADPVLQAVLGTGFLGGYTTFSTASVDTVRLLQQGRLGRGAANALASLVVCTALAGLGLATGLAWAR